MALRTIQSGVFAAAVSLTAFSLAIPALAIPAQAQAEGPQPIQVVMHVQAKGDNIPTLGPGDLQVEYNGKKITAAQVAPLGGKNGAPVQVALLIDDGLRANFGTQLHEIEEFVKDVAGPSVSLGVGYMRNGAAYFPAGFSTEPEQELKAIRLPISTAGVDGSPYFCLQDLVRKWQIKPGVAHVVLMITSGIDRYNGSVSPLNQNSPYVDEATKDAQRAGVPVYSIYYGRREVNSNLGSMSGQSYLAQVAEGTGGDTFNGGSINPVSLSPYFKEFERALSESYLLQFQSGGTRLQSLKVKSNVSGVKIRVQKDAGVPGAK